LSASKTVSSGDTFTLSATTGLSIAIDS
jgi:hypothetical protein